MSALEICFWMLLADILYPSLVYPLMLALAARLWARPVNPTGPRPQSVILVVVGYNEAAYVENRLLELRNILSTSKLSWEMIFVSDGSTDATAFLARQVPGVLVLELTTNRGKARAL